MTSTAERLLREALILAVLVGLVVIADGVHRASGALEGGEAVMVLGCSLLAAHLLGRILLTWGLPVITGHLLAGVILGPYVVDLITTGLRADLSVINDLALGLIALTAGGEMSIQRLRPRFRAIGWITLSHLVIICGGTAAVVLAVHAGGLAGELSPTHGMGWSHVAAFTIILAVTAAAKSPATTIAVITAARSRGPVTDLCMGVTVLKDVIVIFMVAAALAIAAGLVGEGPQHEGAVATTVAVLAEVLVSLLLGAGLGGALYLWLRRVGRGSALFLLAALVATNQAVHLIEVGWHVEAHLLLACMVAGFLVENLSERGEALIHAVGTSSLPIYCVFFVLAGASLDLRSLRDMWPAAVALAGLRGVLIFGSTWAGAKLAGEGPAVRRLTWTGMLGQARVTIGLVELCRRRFPVFGDELATVVLAALALNQLVGPVLFQIGLRRAGEIGMADRPDEDPVPLAERT